MNTSERTEQEVADIIRRADAEFTRAPSAAVWERVAAEVQASAKPQLRVVHSANRSRNRILLAVAACLVAVLTVVWQFATKDDQTRIATAPELQRTIERSALEGPLELERAGQATALRRELYDGVVVKVGEMSTSALQVCEAC